jgi:chromate reductase
MASLEQSSSVDRDEMSLEHFISASLGGGRDVARLNTIPHGIIWHKTATVQETFPMPQPLRLLGLSGSLRRASYSTAVLIGLRDALALTIALDIFSLHEVPLYNEDDDGEQAPQPVRALRSAIATSDGVLLVSPEYNHGMSGVLKNGLDWASRPYGRSALVGKPVLSMTTSPAFTGGVRAQQQMNETLASVQARLVLRPQIVIGSVHEKVRDGRLVDEAALRFALAGVDDLVGDIRAARFLRQAA